jgi:hypothetical protein
MPSIHSVARQQHLKQERKERTLSMSKEIRELIRWYVKGCMRSRGYY